MFHTSLFFAFWRNRCACTDWAVKKSAGALSSIKRMVVLLACCTKSAIRHDEHRGPSPHDAAAFSRRPRIWNAHRDDIHCVMVRRQEAYRIGPSKCNFSRPVASTMLLSIKPCLVLGLDDRKRRSLIAWARCKTEVSPTAKRKTEVRLHIDFFCMLCWKPWDLAFIVVHVIVLFVFRMCVRTYLHGCKFMIVLLCSELAHALPVLVSVSCTLVLPLLVVSDQTRTVRLTGQR